MGLFDFKSKKRLKAEWTPQASPTEVSSSGAIVLKPQNGSLVARMLLAWFFALFWNGIVGTALFSDGPALLFLFMLPFAGVGLLLLWHALQATGALFNAKPELSFSQSQLRPGEELQVSYQLVGGVTRPRSLQMALEAREEATFVQGTTTSTSKETFFYQEILQTESQIASGTLSIFIPAHTMHSFEAPNNKIVWLLTLHAPISFWPDIKEEWKIVVLPAR